MKLVLKVIVHFLLIMLLTACAPNDVHGSESTVEPPLEPTVFLPTPTPTPEQNPEPTPIVIERPVSVKSVVAILNKPVDSLAEYDIAVMTSLEGELDLSGSELTRIDALQYATNLVSLDLGYNRIEDFSPLIALQNLKELCLARNNLGGTDNKLLSESIEIARKLPNLQVLDLSSNKITSLIGIENLTNLRKLIIENNDEIENFAPLALLEGLESLSLNYCGLTDISVLRPLTNLKELDLGENYSYDDDDVHYITDISALSGMTKMEHLDLYGSDIKDISALGGMDNLQWLSLAPYCSVTDISALKGKLNMQVLALTGGNIVDISALAGMKNLTLLWLGRNKIRDISPLQGLTELQELDLGRNKIEKIDALGNLINLKILLLRGNEIEKIDALSRLTNLAYLTICRNKIKSLEPLRNLKNLKGICVDDNPIRDFSPIDLDIIGTGYCDEEYWG